MDTTEILTSVVGSSPFAAFLVWYIITERKAKKEVVIELKDLYSDLQKQNSSREDKLFNVLLANQKVLESTQSIMQNLSDKYEDLSDKMTKGFADTNAEIKSVYRDIISRYGGDN